MRTNIKMKQFVENIEEYTQSFKSLNEAFAVGKCDYVKLEKLLGSYTDFILSEENRKIWKDLDTRDPEIRKLINEAQLESAHSVWAMEKIRAIRYLEKADTVDIYFKNIENCIDSEFGQFKPNSNSKILMFGVGSFPMTALLIARNLNAKVVGIDIDEEALKYARKIIDSIDENLDIDLMNVDYHDFFFVREATHIIFASTIPEKFQILEDLYDLTNKDITVVMRYGNDIKELFNYPLKDLKSSAWIKVNDKKYKDSIFDVAIYKK